jgi:hypothetical protein
MFAMSAPASSAPAPAPTSAPAPAAASAASPNSFDDFGDFSSAPSAAPTTTAAKIDAKVKSDSLWGLADLDLAEEKPAPKKQTGNSMQNMFSSQPQGDAFAGLVGANNAPPPTLRPMQQGGNMGMPNMMPGMQNQMGYQNQNQMGYQNQNQMGYGGMMPQQQQNPNNYW